MNTPAAIAIDGTPRAVALAEFVRTRLEAVLGALCAAILVALTLTTLVTVLLRYVFRTGILGADDLAIWLHVALIGFGAPLALGGALGMRLDVITRWLPTHLKAVAVILADALTMVSCLALLSGSATIMSRLGGLSPTLGLPEWIRFSFFGIGGALTLAVLILGQVAERRIVTLAISLGLALALYFGARFVHLPSDYPPSFIAGLVALIGILIGAPLPHAFLASAYLAVPFGSTLPEQAIVASTVAGISKFLLLAIPFFLLAGGFFTISGLVTRLIGFATAMVGHFRSGLAQTTLLTSVLFSGASGSSIANAAFGATTFAPALVARGYPPPRAAAIVAATSILDNIIPPSIAFLILAAATNLSVGKLLVGGFFAGIVLAACLAVAIHFSSFEPPRRQRASAAERWRATRSAFPAFGLGVIVVVGIRFGVVTTTEAAALAVLYAFVACLFDRPGFASLFAVTREAAVSTSSIGLLIASAAPFAFLLAVDDVGDRLVGLAADFAASPFGVLILANLFLLAVGLLLDIGAAILLFGPILLPPAVAAGIDPIQFGVILVVNLMIGGLHPPIGVLVYVVSGVTRQPVTAIFLAILPYLAALLVSLAILCLYAGLTAGSFMPA
jgi:tripartite ATP-independent transporter DctM subunit